MLFLLSGLYIQYALYCPAKIPSSRIRKVDISLFLAELEFAAIHETQKKKKKKKQKKENRHISGHLDLKLIN